METAVSKPAPVGNWSVFVLRNPAGLCFVGHTDTLPEFLATADVNVAQWTKQPGPWPLVWRHDGLTEAAAMKYEISLKRDKGTPRFYARTGLTPPTTVEKSTVPSAPVEPQNPGLRLE